MNSDSRFLVAKILLGEKDEQIVLLRSALNSLIVMHEWKLKEYQGWTKESQEAAYAKARRALEETK